jgi:quinol monooxygenase YgiN
MAQPFEEGTDPEDLRMTSSWRDQDAAGQHSKVSRYELARFECSADMAGITTRDAPVEPAALSSRDAVIAPSA